MAVQYSNYLHLTRAFNGNKFVGGRWTNLVVRFIFLVIFLSILIYGIPEKSDRRNYTELEYDEPLFIVYIPPTLMLRILIVVDKRHIINIKCFLYSNVLYFETDSIHNSSFIDSHSLEITDLMIRNH